MSQDLCTVRISTHRSSRHAVPSFEKPPAVHRLSPSTPIQITTSFLPTSVLDPMPSPPHTPPLLSYSPNVTPCTSVERSPARLYTALPSPVTERKTKRAAPTATPQHRRDEEHVRRPANPFILFACEYRKGHKGKNNRELSKEAGALWKIMKEADKDMWRERAASVKTKHAEDNPGYRYQPRRRDTPRRPPTRSEGRKQASTSLILLPPSPVTMPRKSAAGPIRTARTRPSIKNDEYSGLDPSILESPTLRASTSARKLPDLASLTPTHTPDIPSELTLPSLTLPLSTPSTVPAAGSSSALVQPQYVALNGDGSFYPQPWLSFSQRADEGQSWGDLSLSPYMDLVPAVWDQGTSFAQRFTIATGTNETPFTPMNSNSNRSYTAHNERPNFDAHFDMMGNALASHYHPLLDNSNRTRGA